MLQISGKAVGVSEQIRVCCFSALEQNVQLYKQMKIFCIATPFNGNDYDQFILHFCCSRLVLKCDNCGNYLLLLLPIKLSDDYKSDDYEASSVVTMKLMFMKLMTTKLMITKLVTRKENNARNTMSIMVPTAHTLCCITSFNNAPVLAHGIENCTSSNHVHLTFMILPFQQQTRSAWTETNNIVFKFIFRIS